MAFPSKGIIISIHENIVTIKVDGYPYDFPQQMIPSNAKLYDKILITKDSIELIKSSYQQK